MTVMFYLNDWSGLGLRYFGSVLHYVCIHNNANNGACCSYIGSTGGISVSLRAVLLFKGNRYSDRLDLIIQMTCSSIMDWVTNIVPCNYIREQDAFHKAISM